MPIKWKNEYTLGIKTIDMQHKKFVSILSNLNDSLHKLEPKALDEAISKLKEYSKYHIEAENKLFEKLDYPDKKIHIEEHEKFLKYIDDLKDKLSKSNNIQTSIDLIDYLEDWMISHEQNMDKKYVPFFIKNGVI